MTPGNDDLNEMVEDTSPESRRATRGPVSGSDPVLAALHAALTDLASDPAPTPTGELAALLDGTVRPLRGGGRRRHVGTVGITIASVVTLSATAAAAITGVAPRAMDTIEGLLPGRAAQAPASSPAPGSAETGWGLFVPAGTSPSHLPTVLVPGHEDRGIGTSPGESPEDRTAKASSSGPVVQPTREPSPGTATPSAAPSGEGPRHGQAQEGPKGTTNGKAVGAANGKAVGAANGKAVGAANGKGGAAGQDPSGGDQEAAPPPGAGDDQGEDEDQARNPGSSTIAGLDPGGEDQAN